MLVVGRFRAIAALLFILTLSCGASAQTAPADDDVNAAAAAFRAEQYPRAAALFRKVVTADPQNAAAWHFLGQSLEKNGDMIGARQAYRQSIATDTSGKVAERTRPMLEKLPLPDATKIVLPSGLTLLDWMNISAKTPSGTPADVVKESAGYIRDYGPFPQLTAMRDSALKTALSNLDVNSADSARKALPLIAELRASAGDTPDLLSLSARAKHATGDFAAAKADYSRWLQIAPADSAKRTFMAENLLKAGRGEPPALQPVRPTLPFEVPEAFWSQIENLDLYRKAPAVRAVDTGYDELDEGERLNKGEYRLTGAGLREKLIVSRKGQPLDSPGCYQSDFHIQVESYVAPTTTSYSCGGGFIPIPTVEMQNKFAWEFSGSIFPLTQGASMTIITRQTDASRRYVSVQRYTVTGRVDASTLHPKLTGVAWELAMHRETTTTDSGKVTTSAVDNKDFFIEDLGLLQGAVGANLRISPEKTGRSGVMYSTIPVDGAVFHGFSGFETRYTFSNTHFDLH